MGSSFLRLQSVTVYVRDQDRSLRFYVDQLGFKLIADAPLPDGTRFVAVAPSDGSAMLTLIAPQAGSEDFKFIGRNTQVVFLAEDVHAKFAEWQEHGVICREVPFSSDWRGMLASFEDPDGNSFALVGLDAATRRIEADRRAEAARVQTEERAAQELDIARQVQARLFPQSKPTADALDYAGVCIQAREVGGDYYDFLALGPDRLGLVIGDIAGKGIAGALLMANLQANLRSQCANALDNPISRLTSVNRLFYDNTADTSYATLFFGEYLPQSHCLRYANCGHLPGLLLHSDGALDKLHSTSTVLGLFKQWECIIREVPFDAGDLLVLYTDGVTEAATETGEEFGEDRLVDALRRHQTLGPPDLIQAMVEEVRAFAVQEQQDDFTLIVARVKNGTARSTG